jgi:hypothetical protein
MRIRLGCFTPILGSVATAVAIAAAPIASAVPSATQSGTGATQSTDPSAPAQAEQSCTSLGSSQTVCQSPGNAQIFAAPPQVDYQPYAGGAD